MVSSPRCARWDNKNDHETPRQHPITDGVAVISNIAYLRPIWSISRWLPIAYDHRSPLPREKVWRDWCHGVDVDRNPVVRSMGVPSRLFELLSCGLLSIACFLSFCHGIAGWRQAHCRQLWSDSCNERHCNVISATTVQSKLIDCEADLWEHHMNRFCAVELVQKLRASA